LFKPNRAVAVLVFNELKTHLLIELAPFLNGKASLPKGAIDDEDEHEAAKRELAEECGIVADVEYVGVFNSKYQVVHVFECFTDKFGQPWSKDEVEVLMWV
jgi:8-oxo-dGTP pyrophosphatase MutT (NUDIX family)